MKKLIKIFSKINTPQTNNVLRDSTGNPIEYPSISATPKFTTVIPPDWYGYYANDAQIKAWCKKMNVSKTYNRFEIRKPKPILELVEKHTEQAFML